MRIISILILFFAAPTLAQTTQPASGSDIRVFLITLGPGAAPYERFGHNMIWIHDPNRIEPDIAYNWGVFKFDNMFVFHFIQGHLRYWIDAWDAPRALEFYKKENRSIWLQELNLSPKQKLALQTKLEWNREEEHKYYTYDYYRDNCSSRARDALNEVLNGQLKAQTAQHFTGTTYRWHTRRLAQDDWYLYIALNFIMGHPIDRDITTWQQMFLPVKMMETLRGIKVEDDSGNLAPLVLSERQIYQSTAYIEKDSPPHWTGLFLAVGALLGILFVALTLLRNRFRHAAATIPLAILLVLWSFIGGIAGSFSTYAWLFTDHFVARYNENWLQLPPLMFPLVILIPLALRRRKGAIKWSRILAVATVALNLVGLILKIFPSLYQHNAEIIALAIPANLGLLLALMLIRTTGFQPVHSDVKTSKN
jgi:hypothetical protein